VHLDVGMVVVVVVEDMLLLLCMSLLFLLLLLRLLLLLLPFSARHSLPLPTPPEVSSSVHNALSADVFVRPPFGLLLSPPPEFLNNTRGRDSRSFLTARLHAPFFALAS
jgi:hypothetical protein